LREGTKSNAVVLPENIVELEIILTIADKYMSSSFLSQEEYLSKGTGLLILI